MIKAYEANGAVLVIHILIGLIETFRFAVLDLSHDPVAGWLDVALCLGQSVTNAVLVGRMKRGLAYITRGSLYNPNHRDDRFIGRYHVSTPSHPIPPRPY
jgi:hypothetical protein